MKTPDFKIRDEGYYITFIFQTDRAVKLFRERIGSGISSKYDSLRNSVCLSPDDYKIMFEWIKCENLELDSRLV
jgi:hypothetical protein